MHINIENENYEVIVVRKNNKNLYIRVTEDLKVKITCPFMYTKSAINKILDENIMSIKKMINKQKLKNETKKDEGHMLLGKKINVCYKDVKKAVFESDTVYVKDDKMLDNWYKKKALEIFKTYLDEAYYVFDEKIPYPILKVRSMKTRWGVCNRKDNSVTLNLELIKKDHKYLNYVIVHELSHFVHFNHSASFWKTVGKYCPDYKIVRKELKE